ncbi:MAG: 30S ribosomal protein S20 [Verrucomicrobiota bacterium]
MPILKSAMKRMRTSEKSRVQNANVRSHIKTVRGRLFGALKGKKREDSEKLFREYCSLLDKSAKKGVIKRNTAIRRKSRAAAWLKEL